MEWINSVSYFLGGAFLMNAIPHLVSGTMGRSFQSPFAKPPGQGLSSSTVNVLWGSFNTVVAYLLVFRVGAFDLRSTGHVLATGSGAISVALMLARTFGRFHGGNSPNSGKRARSPRDPRTEGKAMPFTKLDDNSALIAIDLQKGVVGLPTAHSINEIVDRSAKLARAFRQRGLPVVLVNVSGRAPGRTDAGSPKFAFPADWTELVPELEQHSGDHIVTKQRWGAFLGTALDDYLRQRGATQVVLTGVATSIGVESTARSAYDLGYNVTLVVDAMTDRDADAHRHSIEKIFPCLGETAKTDDVLKLLKEAPPRA